MARKSDDIKKFIETIRTERDDINVKLNLAKADAKDEWLELERKWQGIERVNGVGYHNHTFAIYRGRNSSSGAI
jgi:hypothetical protein